VTDTTSIFLDLEELAKAISSDNQKAIKSITKKLEVQGILNHLESQGYSVILKDNSGYIEINSRPLSVHSHLITNYCWADHLVDRLNAHRNGLPINLEYACVGENKIKLPGYR
jgi:hypothetical protein